MGVIVGSCPYAVIYIDLYLFEWISTIIYHLSRWFTLDNSGPSKPWRCSNYQPLKMVYDPLRHREPHVIGCSFTQVCALFYVHSAVSVCHLLAINIASETYLNNGICRSTLRTCNKSHEWRGHYPAWPTCQLIQVELVSFSIVHQINLKYLLGLVPAGNICASTLGHLPRITGNAVFPFQREWLSCVQSVYPFQRPIGSMAETFIQVQSSYAGQNWYLA